MLVGLWIRYALGGPKTPPGLRQSLRGSLPTACRRKRTGEAAEGHLSRSREQPMPRCRRVGGERACSWVLVTHSDRDWMLEDQVTVFTTVQGCGRAALQASQNDT
jgi:hypothetical protein